MAADAPPQAYLQRAAPIARDVMRRSGIPASVMLAQSALESNFGRSELAQQANNYFGFRVGNAAWAATDPFWDGSTYGDGWRKYATVKDSFLDFARNFYRGQLYQAALELLPDPVAFLLAEAPVYAPPAQNPDYAQHVLAILSEYALTRYDLPAAQLALDPSIVPPAYRAA